MSVSLHEEFTHKIATKSSSNRGFGLVFAVFFVLVGVSPLRHQLPVRMWALALAALFAVIALSVPRVLGPLNKVWTQLGLLLSKIVNPVVTALIFFLVVLPTGLVFRLQGQDRLRLKKDPKASSYWIVRTPPGPAPESMANQF